MSKIKSYLQMKYEQFLIRTFDFILKVMRNTRVDWYPNYALGLEACEEKYEKKIDELWNTICEQDQCISQLEYGETFLEDEIQHLEELLHEYKES